MLPIIKYSGGKRKEYKHFAKYIPKQFSTYYEPFCGGGATFFALQPQKAYLGDINYNLIRFYRDLRENFPLVQQELQSLHVRYEKQSVINKQFYHKYKRYNSNDSNQFLYYNVRRMFNGLKAPRYHYATLYYFLNKIAYAGMIRYNQKGQFNVPFGRYLNFGIKPIDKDHVQLLKRASINCQSYQKSFQRATSNDFMFLDPPYDSRFSLYGNKHDFNQQAQVKLAQYFKKSKCKTMLVIASTSLIKKLYQPYIKATYHKNYSVNIRNRFKSQAEHLVITNY